MTNANPVVLGVSVTCLVVLVAINEVIKVCGGGMEARQQYVISYVIDWNQPDKPGRTKRGLIHT